MATPLITAPLQTQPEEAKDETSYAYPAVIEQEPVPEPIPVPAPEPEPVVVAPPPRVLQPGDSTMVDSDAQNEFLASLLPPGKRLSLLYRASRDGWRGSDFHTRCDGRGATLTFVKSTKGFVCGGFTMVPWAAPSTGKAVRDAEAFLVALTGDFQVFRPQDPDKAVNHTDMWGPEFGTALGLISIKGAPMNQPEQAYCFVGGCDGGKYMITTGKDGNNVLTGDGARWGP